MTNVENITNTLSDHYVDVIAWDSRIVADSQKYSGWFLAFTTAGLALIITQSAQLITDSWLDAQHAASLVLISAFFLFAASALGVMHHYLAKEYIANNRRMRTLVLKQKCWLLIHAEGVEFNEDIGSQIKSGEFLDGAAKSSWHEFEDVDAKLTWKLAVALGAQQGCAGIGYIGLLLSSFDQRIWAAISVLEGLTTG